MPCKNRPLLLLLYVLFAGLACFNDLPAHALEQPAKNGGQESATQTVTAEGVGASADAAIKDAFRAAVRQVVGAVVDAETMVKDDSIINDSILTYSDGFVSAFTEIAGSKSVNSGVHRLRIKATVERKSLVAKLRAANVSMISIDGQGLFAEVTSQLQSEADASAILAKHFEDFPGSCVKISILGKPETVEKSSEDIKVRFKVLVEPDLMAFKAFRTKLIWILEKTAKPIGEVTVLFQERSDPELGNLFSQSTLPLTAIVPASFRRKDGYSPSLKQDFVVCVETSRTKKSDRADYRNFKLEPGIALAFKDAMCKRGEAKLRLTDADGEVVATSVLNPFVEIGEMKFPTYLGSVFARRSHGDHRTDEYAIETGTANFELGAICMVAPVFCCEKSDVSEWFRLAQKNNLVFEAMFNLSHDELRAVKNAKAEITYQKK